MTAASRSELICENSLVLLALGVLMTFVGVIEIKSTLGLGLAGLGMTILLITFAVMGYRYERDYPVLPRSRQVEAGEESSE